MTSDSSNSINIECTKENFDSNYKKIQAIINSIQPKINDAIAAKFPEINEDVFNGIYLHLSKSQASLTTNIIFIKAAIHESQNVNIEIRGKFDNLNSDQISLILEYYKDYIRKELLKNNINRDT